jgi:antitoxin ParD1/3/4
MTGLNSAQTASDRDALRALQRRREDALKLKNLRARVKAGTDALDRGDFVEIDGADLDEYLERLTTPAARRAR